MGGALHFRHVEHSVFHTVRRAYFFRPVRIDENMTCRAGEVPTTITCDARDVVGNRRLHQGHTRRYLRRDARSVSTLPRDSHLRSHEPNVEVAQRFILK